MKWNEEWGDKEEEHRRIQEKTFNEKGVWVNFPSLESKPELDEFHLVYISEFFFLSASRTSNGFGMNPLQYTEIISFLLLGLSIIPDTPAEYAEVMRIIDNKYLTLKAEKEKSKEKAYKAPPKPSPPKKR